MEGRGGDCGSRSVRRVPVVEDGIDRSGRARSRARLRERGELVTTAAGRARLARLRVRDRSTQCVGAGRSARQHATCRGRSQPDGARSPHRRASATDSRVDGRASGPKRRRLDEELAAIRGGRDLRARSKRPSRSVARERRGLGHAARVAPDGGRCARVAYDRDRARAPTRRPRDRHRRTSDRCGAGRLSQPGRTATPFRPAVGAHSVRRARSAQRRLRTLRTSWRRTPGLEVACCGGRVRQSCDEPRRAEWRGTRSDLASSRRNARLDTRLGDRSRGLAGGGSLRVLRGRSSAQRRGRALSLAARVRCASLRTRDRGSRRPESHAARGSSGSPSRSPGGSDGPRHARGLVARRFGARVGRDAVVDRRSRRERRRSRGRERARLVEAQHVLLRGRRRLFGRGLDGSGAGRAPLDDAQRCGRTLSPGRPLESALRRRTARSCPREART